MRLQGCFIYKPILLYKFWTQTNLLHTYYYFKIRFEIIIKKNKVWDRWAVRRNKKNCKTGSTSTKFATRLLSRLKNFWKSKTNRSMASSSWNASWAHYWLLMHTCPTGARGNGLPTTILSFFQWYSTTRPLRFIPIWTPSTIPSEIR